MVFLPGDHTLGTNITVTNVTRLTMHGESSSGNRATVVCSGSVGLSFANMMDLKINSLAFTSCNRRYIITLPDIPLAGIHGALLFQSTQYAELVNCFFHDNIATGPAVNGSLAGNSDFTHSHRCAGGAIIALDSNLTFIGITTFLENAGGAISASYNTVLNFNGTSNFINNSAGDDGGAISTTDNAVLNFNGINNFVNNLAEDGGAISMSDNAVLSFNGTNNFINNLVRFAGGAIVMDSNTVLSFNGTNNFINNSAGSGGAINTLGNQILSFNGINNFINNSASDGGAIYTYEGNNILLNLNGTNNFINNSGSAISIDSNTVVNFIGTSNFINNSAGNGGAIYTSYNTVLNFTGTSNFINNSAQGGGAIYADINTSLTFNGTIYFTNNGHYGSGIDIQDGYSYGGGVYIGIQSTLSILPNTTVYWENNHANLGGAIYVHDASPYSYCDSVATLVPVEKCFYQLPGQNLSNGIDVQFVFKNNTADAAGSVLYGSVIDNCKLTHGLDSDFGAVFDMLVHIEDDTHYKTTSVISSDPLQICSCENLNFPYCSEDNWYGVPHTVYPGEKFQVSVAGVGQRDGTVPSTVRSTINQRLNPGDVLDPQYQQQQTNKTCTTLSYAVSSLSQTVDIELHAEGSPCSNFDDYTLDITVYINQTCPPGFSISESAKSCVCESRLAQYTLQCSIENGVGQITRDSSNQFWVGYDDQSQSDDKVILHPLCPFKYCVSHTVVFPLNESDIQCAYNRSGLLCGACKKGYSLVLGTSHCRKCTNNFYLALLILFAVMGVVLVFLLLVCKLTVATGTLSGLVFYANIVGVNHTIFLPGESTDAFSVFIAWLNLDFGIETCFYNGLDAYSKTWLQFVFPVYIWVLVGLTIFASNCSRRFAKLLGNNPVSVLATLIHLSYAKILRTLIAVFYITYLEYPTYDTSVWLYDANIDYLSGKHIPLFLVAVLVFLFFFIPYTVLLLFGQWLQAISHLRLFSWVNSARLKPFMDSYHAPYKAKHRYWPGLLLVLRFVLLAKLAFLA